MTELQQAAKAVIDKHAMASTSVPVYMVLDLSKALEAEQAQAPLPTKTSWKNLVLWYEAGANDWDNLRSIVTKMLDSHPAATGERAELISHHRRIERASPWESLKAIAKATADMIGTDTKALQVAVAVPEVQWGVDWGSHGDRSCVSIIKKYPNGSIEVVATEYEPQKGAK